MPPLLLHHPADRPLTDDVELATTAWRRFKGLMLRRSLPGALVIRPCSSIHSFFMRVPIDVAFVDREGVVLRVHRGLRPRRVTRVVRHARACIETPAGGLEAVQVGHVLQVTEGAPAPP